MSVTACTNPSTFAPMTLIGKADGYRISDCSRGMSCMVRLMPMQMGTRAAFATASAEGSAGCRRAGRHDARRLDRLPDLRALVGLVQPCVHRPGLAAQRTVPDRISVERGHRQHLLRRGTEQDLVGREHLAFRNGPQVERDAALLAQLADQLVADS